MGMPTSCLLDRLPAQLHWAATGSPFASLIIEEMMLCTQSKTCSEAKK